MAHEYAAPGWDNYRFDTRNAYAPIEPLADEIAAVEAGLIALREDGVIPHINYDHDKLLAHRQFVVDHYEMPWTAIGPRMQRLIYALNAITQPQVMIAAGVFCGNTFISNAGAAVGPGASYTASALIGVEIVPAEAERAERNTRRIDPTGVARVVAADAVDVVSEWDGPVNLLYLDADGTPETGKGIYLTILEAAWDKLTPGALILAHNSINCADALADYLRFVRETGPLRTSWNMKVDGEGLEVSLV